MEYFVVVFKNTHDAMTAEKKLIELNYDIRVMPTPTAITQSCGICIRMEKYEAVKSIIEARVINFKGIYKRYENGYQVIME